MATSENRPLGLVIPTRWEAGVILKRFSWKRLSSSLYRSSISGRPVLLCISGVGREAARRAADRLVAEGAKELLSMGFCGALVPGLNVGDLVTDRVATVDNPARTAAERQALTERANAVAVDMETQAIIEAGTRRGVPIGIRRVVSDEMTEDLTPLFGSKDGFSPLRIALRLMNPLVWPLAYRLYCNSRTARERLADVLGTTRSDGIGKAGWREALGLLILFWVLYAGKAAKQYSYDGILYALDVEFGSAAQWFHPGHLLYSAIMKWFLHLGGFLGFQNRAIVFMQAFNAFIAAAAVAMFGMVISQKFGRWIGFAMAALFGLSHSFWMEAVDPGCYALAGFAAVALLAVLLRSDDDPAWMSGVLHGVTVLFHQLLLMATPAFLAAFFLRSQRALKSSVHYVLGLFIGAVLPYGLVMVLFHPGPFSEKLKWAFIPAGTPVTVKMLDAFWWNWGVRANINPMWQAWAQSLLAPAKGAELVAAVFTVVLILGSLALVKKRDEGRSEILICWKWILSASIFLFFFHHTTRYMILILPPVLFVFSAILAGLRLTLPRRAAIGVGLCLLGAVNFSRAISPRLVPNTDGQRLAWIKGRLRSSDFFLFMGRGPHSLTNVFVAYFAPELPARSIYGYLLTQFDRPDATMAGLTTQILTARVRGGKVWAEEDLLSAAVQRQIELDERLPEGLVQHWFHGLKSVRRETGPDGYALVELIPAFQAK